MAKLNRALLNSNFAIPSEVKVTPDTKKLPEKILLFGEGNFLRAFVDWMIQQLNSNGLFQGFHGLTQKEISILDGWRRSAP